MIGARVNFNRLFALVLSLGLTTFINPAIAGMAQRATPTPRYDQTNTEGYAMGRVNGTGEEFFIIHTKIGMIILTSNGRATAINETTKEEIHGYFSEYNQCNWEVTLDNFVVYITKPECYE